MAIMIDSTQWISWIRKKIDPRPMLNPWLVRNSCFTCGIINLEVLRGIIQENQKNKFSNFFKLLYFIDIDKSMWDKASETAWELDRKGHILPLTDILIAQCCMNNNIWLVSQDKHFKFFKKLKLRSSLPVGK